MFDAQVAPKRGKLFLVGFGPGSHEHLTFRAKAAIDEAEIVIGYRTYILLIKDLLHGKKVIYTGMTEELSRARRAIEFAFEGHKVALISSGDVGIYGMAGPAFELLKERNWTPGELDVEVIPGVTAVSSCASILGAPLVHDFCTISLSDLLTPWDVIVKRLKGAAESDFVIGLYNPKSGRRTRQIVEAQRIISQYRTPQTPVGIIKSCKRELENVVITTLADMLNHEIGMLTTIIIGNSNSFRFHDYIITPRGYTNKYNLATSEVRPGQRPAHSLDVEALDRDAAASAGAVPTSNAAPKTDIAGLAAPQAETLEVPAPSRTIGTLYGIGVGPGDPQYLTVRSTQILGNVKHVFYPSSSGTDESLALNVIEPYLGRCVKFHQLYFPMTKDRVELEKHWKEAAEQVWNVVGWGKDAAFVTLGDCTIYSTYMYLLKTLKETHPEIVYETVPGISSFQVAVALIDQAVAEGKERVALVPVNREVSNVEDALDHYDTIVLFKVGSKLPQVMDLLERKGLMDCATLFSYLGTPDQTIARSLREVKREKIGYMSLMLIKKPQPAASQEEEEAETQLEAAPVLN